MLRLVSVLSLLSYTVGKITFDNLEPCEPNTDYEVSLSYKINNDNEMQILEEGILTTKIDMDDNIEGTIYVYILDGEEWNLLLSIHDKICQIRKKILSTIGVEFENAAGLIEYCPRPKGEYKIADFPLDFEKFDNSMVPRGKLRVKGTLSHENTDDILACHIIDFTVTDD